MSYFKKVREWWSAPKSNLEPAMQVRAGELIFVLGPDDTASIDVPHGSTVRLFGLCGIVWVTVQGSLTDYCVRNGETVEIPGAGLMVFESCTENVLSKIQVSITRKAVH